MMTNEEELYQLKARVAELEGALVEVSGMNSSEPLERLEDRQSWERVKRIYSRTPAQSLLLHDAEVLERFADWCCTCEEANTGYFMDVANAHAADLRQQAEEK